MARRRNTPRRRINRRNGSSRGRRAGYAGERPLSIIETVAETGSTNDDLLARAIAGAPEGLWFRAERQTGGKGRQGRHWLSPPGNLHISTLVRVRPDDPPAPTLALVAAVALHASLCRYCVPAQGVGLRDRPATASNFAGAPELQIKWPNDIMAGDAKLAGILLERAGDAVVIGFGANLAHHPEGLGRPTTSLAVLAGAAPDPHEVANGLADVFAAWLNRWRVNGLDAVRTAWLAAAHPLGTPLTTSEGQGVFDGLGEDGALRLRLPSGEPRILHAGDVFLV